MNNDQRFVELWNDYLEGELDGTGIAELQQLLASDDSFLETAADSFRTHRLLGFNAQDSETRHEDFVRATMAMLPADDDKFVSDLMRKLPDSVPTRTRPDYSLRSVVFAAAALLLVTVPTGIATWDEACDETGGRGLGDWWYVALGGASNSGKTKLMLHLIRRAAEAGLLPGLITMEVPLRGLQRQVYSNITSFGYYDLLPRRWENGDAVAKTQRLNEQVASYHQGAAEPRSILVAEQDAPPTLTEIMDGCEALLEAGSRCIFLDHLQLIRAPAGEIADRATEISESLRWFAHSRKCLVVALSQLNRLASRERDRRPTMHDLLGGTSIESNSNQVILLDHSKQQRDPLRPHLLKTWLYLARHDGSTALSFSMRMHGKGKCR